ncbi:hypothetical protein E5K00_08600 [Hymenobacter aquaticus]|uniref:Uncharacterized protein n=1 Tax=Hymenobacter aquaticus TaxID=1867101 RepID=A0A4Z0Q6F6_9BACT|nr:hypothetical protein E5K00_08600 [Hymenobacter aquaticus]
MGNGSALAQVNELPMRAGGALVTDFGAKTCGLGPFGWRSKQQDYASQKQDFIGSTTGQSIFVTPNYRKCLQKDQPFHSGICGLHVGLGGGVIKIMLQGDYFPDVKLYGFLVA